MASAVTLLKKFANVNHCVIDSFEFVTNAANIATLKIHLHPLKSYSDRCPVCGKRCPVYDVSTTECKWRALDFGGIIAELYYCTKRVECPEHGVKTASVPWAFNGSRFTKDFDMMATFLALNINRSVAAKLLRCDWHTIMRCISRAREFLEPDKSKRYEGLKHIGIDETSYRKGHSYITVVVNHDTNTVVWCSQGHNSETLNKFFEELTQEQRDGIEAVSADGAKWIDASISKYIPNAIRCVDPFHVVSWANESLDALRKEAWRDAYSEYTSRKKEENRGKGRPKSDDASAAELKELKAKAEDIKKSVYTLGKAPEHLTENQRLKLEFISNTDKRLFRGYTLKEQLRLALKIKDKAEVEKELQRFFWCATHSRISVFKELAYKIRRHEGNILNTIETQLSNARVESINNKIKLFIRKAYGFRNIQNMIDMIMLGCSKIFIPLPNRGENGLKAA